MRKIFSILTIFTVLVACIFKILHWPGSYELQIIGNGLLLPIWLIVNLVQDFKSGSSKLLAILSFSSSLLFIVGYLFKMMHWPVANELLIASLFLLFPLFSVVRGHQRQKNQKGAAIIGWILAVFSWTLLFKLMAWPGLEEVYLFAFGLGLPIFFIVLFVNREHLIDFKLGITNERSIVFSAVFLAYLLTSLTRYVHSSALHEQVMRQDQLESQMSREIALADQYLVTNEQILKNQLDQYASDVISSIEELKFDLIRESNGDVKYPVMLDRTIKDKSTSNINISDLDLKHLFRPYDFNIPAHYIIGYDIKTSAARGGLRVYSNWIFYQENRIAILEAFLRKNPNKSLERYIELLQMRLKVQKEDEFGDYKEERHIHWVARNFLSLTTIQAIVKLTEIENEVVRDRNEVLLQLSK